MSVTGAMYGCLACARTIVGAGALIAVVPAAAMAQRPVPPAPDSVAAEFQAALRAMAWSAAAQRMHPEGLTHFRNRVDILVAANPRALLEQVFAGISLEEYQALSDAEVFTRSLRAMMTQMRGLLHAVVVRDVEVIGAVREGPEGAHVVYRSRARLSGANPEMRVMTLKRSPQGWRVVDSAELDVIREAMRGFNRGSAPSP